MNSLSRKKKRLLSRLEWVDFFALFNHLDEHPDTPQSKRVQRVIALLSQMGRKLSRAEAIRVIAELRNIMRAYRWVSQVSPTSAGFRAILFPADREKLSPEDEWEYQAVRDLLILLEDGALSRLRRCDEDGCKKWFYAANRSDQRFCPGGTCRQRHYDRDEERRKKKRAYMRKLYADQKEREQRAKATVIAMGRRKGKPLR